MNEQEAREKIAQYQNLQQQMQTLMVQKETMQMQLIETDKTIEELDKVKDEKVYKISGQIMISKTADEAKSELNETKEAIEIRLQSIEKNEEKITARVKELENELKKLMEK
mgnify:CR=1 FL=1